MINVRYYMVDCSKSIFKNSDYQSPIRYMTVDENLMSATALTG